MEGTLAAGEALADDLRVLVDENRHQAASFTALTIFSAASPRLSADTIGRPESARICLPSSTFVPSRRTTSGTCRLTSRAAATTPSAITSQRMIPPKMLTRMPSTFLSDRMILNAAVTRSLVAPPPTSRKFAGSPPTSLMMSMVAMARPAPLTMQPMLPSSLT
ncbi:malate dehydrogenase [alpha proteobacterium BAL199]|nr:malate dehydrogenase [alpha proteobacterium BAL199]